jgi:hypothetical protein
MIRAAIATFGERKLLDEITTADVERLRDGLLEPPLGVYWALEPAQLRIPFGHGWSQPSGCPGPRRLAHVQHGVPVHPPRARLSQGGGRAAPGSAEGCCGTIPKLARRGDSPWRPQRGML